MKEKTKLRVLQILCIISILITVFSIQRTYAKYFEKVGTTYQTNIKRWLINVNSKNIHEESELSEVMQPIFVENENMKNNNTLVPGRTGYFEMLIDYTNVDLAFEYEFFIEQLNETPLEDFEIYGYEVIDADGTSTITETNEIKGVIDPETEVDSNGEKKRKIRVLFRWNDENKDTTDTAEASGMNNFEDTQFRGETDTSESADGLHTILNYKATMKFTQYIAPAGDEEPGN